MILHALCALAEREGLVGDPDYEYKRVAWLVHLASDGQFLSMESTLQPAATTSGNQRKPQPKQFLIPRQPTGKTGTKAPAAFLVENAKYVFGVPTKDKVFAATEGQEKSTWFREAVAQCADATQDDGAIAVTKFLQALYSGRQNVILPDEVKSNELFAFILGMDDVLVHLRPAVRAFWKQQRQTPHGEGSGRFRCLVTGALINEVGLFPSVRGVPGGSTAGVGLVSFNRRAFESYGWNGSENAPISRAAGEAATTALARLLTSDFPNPKRPEEKLKPRRLSLSSDTVLLYWTASDSGDRFADVFGDLLEATAEDADSVGELYRSVWRGSSQPIDNASAFYALVLSGAQGRAVVRDWIESTVTDAAHNLARHFADFNIVRNAPFKIKPPGIPLRFLLNSLAPQGSSDSIPDALASAVVHAALRGTPYPIALLQNALLRARAEASNHEWSDLARADARAALIKAVLIRTRHLEVTPAMDPTNSNPGYLLGRLMAVIERMQQAALGSQINATVVDRYFSGASATPGVVFPRLLKNLRNHARKAKDEEQTAGLAVWLEGEVDRIVVGLHGFPPYLDLDQQGLFVVGYHHERHWLWLSKTEREACQPGPIAIQN